MQEGEQALLFLRLAAGHAQQRIAGVGNDGADLVLVQGFLGKNHGLSLGVGGRHLVHGEIFADAVIDVGLTHHAHHPVDFQNGFGHQNSFFSSGFFQHPGESGRTG